MSLVIDRTRGLLKSLEVMSELGPYWINGQLRGIAYRN
jgi:hypothetical protein